MIVDISTIELGTGMKYDGESDCFSGVFSGYSFVLQIDKGERHYRVTTAVSESNIKGLQSINRFLDEYSAQELSPLSAYRHKGNTVELMIFNSGDARLDSERIAGIIHHFSIFMSANRCTSGCSGCGCANPLSPVKINGELRLICDGCKGKHHLDIINSEAGYAVDEQLERADYSYTSPRVADIDVTAEQHRLFEIRRELDKGSNMLFGIMGSAAFTLVSAIIWIIIGQTRFLPIMQPILMALLCAIGYRQCAGVLDTRGVVACSVILTISIPVSELFSTILFVYTEIDGYGGVHSFRLTLEWLEQYMSNPVYSGAISIDICIGYLLASVCFVLYCKAKYMIVKK